MPLLLAALAALAVLAAACGGSAGASGTPTAGDPTVTALCQARSQAADPEAAAATFYGDAHTALHEIADDVTSIDRAVAADLLVAKNALESALDAQPPATLLRERLDVLVAATRIALDALGAPTPGCAG